MAFGLNCNSSLSQPDRTTLSDCRLTKPPQSHEPIKRNLFVCIHAQTHSVGSVYPENPAYHGSTAHTYSIVSSIWDALVKSRMVG